MGVLMIRCPVSGREISTGIKTDRSSFRATPVFFAHTYCGFCRREHQWFARDAWVCEGAAGRGVQRQRRLLKRHANAGP